jgi:hypothetical protein
VIREWDDARALEEIDVKSKRIGTQYTDANCTPLRPEVVGDRTNTIGLAAGP